MHVGVLVNEVHREQQIEVGEDIARPALRSRAVLPVQHHDPVILRLGIRHLYELRPPLADDRRSPPSGSCLSSSSAGYWDSEL